jgi:hypothetical protein
MTRKKKDCNMHLPRWANQEGALGYPTISKELCGNNQ